VYLLCFISSHLFYFIALRSCFYNKKKLNFPTVWKNLKFTHQERDERKERKESIDGRVIYIGKGCTSDFELYNTKSGKNDFYR
jgi:hypothetical protein